MTFSELRRRSVEIIRAGQHESGSYVASPTFSRYGYSWLGFGAVDVTPLVTPGGRVHRQAEDVYYGGGEWLLLTALLGLAEPDRARDCLDWIAAHAGRDGELPEQSQDHLLHPEHLEPWIELWGPPACPLLWSQAMFLTLAEAAG